MDNINLLLNLTEELTESLKSSGHILSTKNQLLILSQLSIAYEEGVKIKKESE